MIKNYTSTSTNTLTKIQGILISHQAKSINFEYKDGRVIGLIFVLEIEGKDFGFKLPARVENVEKIFLKNKLAKMHSSWDRERATLNDAEKDQAYRTAWENIRDWVDSQMALIDTEMVKLEEVFLPYMVDNKGQTYFEHLKEQQFLLEEPRSE